MNSRPLNQKCIHCVGIDPDKGLSGFAHYDRSQRRFVAFKALSFSDLQARCLSLDADHTDYYVEAGWQNQGQNSYQLKTLPADWHLWNAQRREAYKFERGVSVGVNFGVGHVIIEVLRAAGRKVIEYRPTIAKWDAAHLKLYTGITDRTNQDVRDAIRAAYMNR